jgi:hypothetical protein
MAERRRTIRRPLATLSAEETAMGRTMISVGTIVLGAAALVSPAAGARALDQTDFQACNDRAMQTAGVSPSSATAPRGADGAAGHEDGAPAEKR